MTHECVINISEGKRSALLETMAAALGGRCLDLHHDPFHNRSVFTLGAVDDEALLEAALELTAMALASIDLRGHEGVHPRLGVVDVVPFVPLGSPPFDLRPALRLRDRFAESVAQRFALPCFVYGPERSLPQVRRRAFVDLAPDFGPSEAAPGAGACCVGARPPLVAYNLVLASSDLRLARAIAREVRSATVRALAFVTGDEIQVSCNLVDPFTLGPAELYALVERRAPIARAELVGLLPEQVLRAIDVASWPRLGLAGDQSLEGRLAALA
jgi:glutamate formiminotransferase